VRIKIVEFRFELVRSRLNNEEIKSNKMGMGFVKLDSIRSRSKSKIWIKLLAIRLNHKFCWIEKKGRNKLRLDQIVIHQNNFQVVRIVYKFLNYRGLD